MPGNGMFAAVVPYPQEGEFAGGESPKAMKNRMEDNPTANESAAGGALGNKVAPSDIVGVVENKGGRSAEGLASLGVERPEGSTSSLQGLRENIRSAFNPSAEKAKTFTSFKRSVVHMTRAVHRMASTTKQTSNMEVLLKNEQSLARGGDKGEGRAGSLGNNWNEIRSQGRSVAHLDMAGETMASIANSLATQYTTQCAFLLVDPRKPWRLSWDLVLFALVTYHAFVTPFEVAFQDVEAGTMFVLNCLVDVMFICDMYLNFTTMYRDPKKGWISNLRWIGRRYLRGPFLMDLVSVFPYDLMALEVWQGKDHLRWTRALRLLKMLRLSRAPRVFSRLEDYVFRINYGLQTIAQFIMITVLLSHWLGCLWGLIPKVEGADQAWTDTLHIPGEQDPEDVSLGKLYANSVYFAVYSITSTGFGDVVPLTNFERYYSVCIMLIGGYFFGYVTGALTSIIGERNANKTEFRKQMDELNRFMEDHGLPAQLRLKLRDFLRYRGTRTSTKHCQELIDSLSQRLRAEVAAHTSCSWVTNVDFFQSCPEPFYVELSLALSTETFCPHEEVIKTGDQPDRMFIVQKGVVASQGMVFTRGLVLGTDMLNINSSKGATLKPEALRRQYFAVALTFADVLVLRKDTIDPILDHFPGVKERLRRAVVRRIFRREVRAYARAVMRVLTGTRSHLSCLHGDPDGREEHYFAKVSIIYMQRDPKRMRATVRAAAVIQRKVRDRWGKVRTSVVPESSRPRKSYGDRQAHASVEQIEDVAHHLEDQLALIHQAIHQRASVSETPTPLASPMPGQLAEEVASLKRAQDRQGRVLDAILAELQSMRQQQQQSPPPPTAANAPSSSYPRGGGGGPGSPRGQQQEGEQAMGGRVGDRTDSGHSPTQSNSSEGERTDKAESDIEAGSSSRQLVHGSGGGGAPVVLPSPPLGDPPPEPNPRQRDGDLTWMAGGFLGGDSERGGAAGDGPGVDAPGAEGGGEAERPVTSPAATGGGGGLDL